jgi:hypothetical protein
MHDEVEGFGKSQRIDEAIQVGYTLIQRERIVFFAGNGREAAPEMVWCDGPAERPQFTNQVPVHERPGRITVEQENRFARTLVHVVQTMFAQVEEMGKKIVQ